MVTINEVFQSLWWLGWVLAAILAFCFGMMCAGLNAVSADLKSTQKALQEKERDNTNLNRENDQLCADNMALEQRNKMLVERLAAVEPKAQELDKMHERAAIVKAAYEKRISERCPSEMNQLLGEKGVFTWWVSLN